MFAKACVLYEVDSCVRGFYEYQDTWTPLVGEELHCEREENIHDRFAVVVKKGSARVGDVPTLALTLTSNAFAIDLLAFLISFVVKLGGVSRCPSA